MTISVSNPTRRPQTIHLIGGALETLEHIQVSKGRTRKISVDVPRSLTIPPGGVRTGLPNECAAEARARGCIVHVTKEEAK